jgi:hypothetical protein
MMHSPMAVPLDGSNGAETISLYEQRMRSRRYTFANSGKITAPCGVPALVSDQLPPSDRAAVIHSKNGLLYREQGSHEVMLNSLSKCSSMILPKRANSAGQISPRFNSSLR